MTYPLDIEAIVARTPVLPGPPMGPITQAVADVHALVAEVRRLRTALANLPVLCESIVVSQLAGTCRHCGGSGYVASVGVGSDATPFQEAVECECAPYINAAIAAVREAAEFAARPTSQPASQPEAKP